MTDGSSGGRGVTYETRVCMLCVVRGYTRGIKDFQLRYQVSEAGKFDDVVFYDGETYQIIQLKHKESKIKISHSQLFTENFNTDYNLFKYLQAFQETNSIANFRDKIKMAVVFTNIDFDLNNKNQLSLITNQRPSAKVWYNGETLLQFDSIKLDNDGAIFDTSSTSSSKYYKFNNDPNVVQILKRQAETTAQELCQHPKWQKCQNEKQRNILKKQEETLIKELINLTLDEIRKALQYIVYAVNQPNDQQLKETIKREISDHFKLEVTDIIYNELEMQFRKWCDTKEPLDDLAASTSGSSSKQNIIDFKDVEQFFQKHLRNASFGVTPPISSFTGRGTELNDIQNKLHVARDLIVCGMGGIGKTELMRQFIKQFGQSDFYGRVIWIEAESDESVKKSFEHVAYRLKIQDVSAKRTEILIAEVFEYFYGLKVLFVFDNFDKIPSNAENLVVTCRKIVSDPTKEHRPYFLFTSRNRECLPNVPSLDLGVLTKEDAKKLIEQGLSKTGLKINYTDQDVAQLAETLQYFPLALQQAIAYVKEQHTLRVIIGKTYSVQVYLSEFIKKREEFLDYKFSDDFGKYAKTTFITWNVTLDAIKADKTNGTNSIEFLKLLSYLYADKIDSKIFSSILKDDDLKTARAFLLLEKYSLITRIGEESSLYQIHRLVQTVVQLKFQDSAKDILEQALTIVNPKLHKQYFHKTKPSYGLIDKCTTDEMLHYNTLFMHIKNHEDLKNKFSKFFHDLHNTVLLLAAFADNIDRIKVFNVPKEDLKEYIESTDVRIMMRKQANRVVKYFIENEYLELNESLVEISRDVKNFEILKFLIEKGADFSKILLFASPQLISDIINGRKESYQNFIKSKSENLTDILNYECTLEEVLLFATIFNQESIVKLLVGDDIVTSHSYRLERSPLLFIAATLNYTSLLETLLQVCDKHDFTENIFLLLADEKFDQIEILELIFYRYCVLGGNINDKDYAGNSFLCYVTQELQFSVTKVGIIQFLLDNGADPMLTNKEGFNALANILVRYRDDLDVDRKSVFDGVFNQITSKMTPEQIKASINSIASIVALRQNQIHSFDHRVLELMKAFGFPT